MPASMRSLRRERRPAVTTRASSGRCAAGRRHPRVKPLLVLASGGIATGADVAAALSNGADGVWVGTNGCLLEAHAHIEYKRRILAASAPATAITTAFGPEFPNVPIGCFAPISSTRSPVAKMRFRLRSRAITDWANGAVSVPLRVPCTMPALQRRGADSKRRRLRRNGIPCGKTALSRIKPRPAMWRR